jgi:preprotein translocase subunit YajC
MLQPTEAPGRAGTATPAAPPAPEATADPGASTAPAPPPDGGGLSMGMMLLLPLVLFGILFLMNRGEKKRRTDMETKLKKGDRVVTRSGITGKLAEVGERTVRVEIAPGVNVTMVKTAIEGLDASDQAATKAASLPEKTGKEDKGAKDDGKKKKK